VDEFYDKMLYVLSSPLVVMISVFDNQICEDMLQSFVHEIT